MIACALTIRPPAPAPCRERKRDQLGHRLAQAREHRAGEEDDDRRQEHGLAPVHVAELAVDRRRDGRGEQVRGDDPGEVAEAAEVADDRRQRGRDDRLVERGQEHAEHQRGEDRRERAPGERRLTSPGAAPFAWPGDARRHDPTRSRNRRLTSDMCILRRMSGIAGEQAGRRSHARRNHELLVETAREVFAERGVEASLEEIARRAGVGIGTLYRHFATRDALVEAVLERRLGDFVGARRRRRRRSPTRGPRSSASSSRRWSCRRATACSRTCSCARRRAPAVSTLRARRLRRLLGQVLERAIAQGQLRAGFTLSDLSLLVWSFAPLIDATAEVAPNAWRRHLHWLLDGLRSEAATPQVEPPLTPEQLNAAWRRCAHTARAAAARLPARARGH